MNNKANSSKDTVTLVTQVRLSSVSWIFWESKSTHSLMSSLKHQSSQSWSSTFDAVCDTEFLYELEWTSNMKRSRFQSSRSHWKEQSMTSSVRSSSELLVLSQMQYWLSKMKDLKIESYATFQSSSSPMQWDDDQVPDFWNIQCSTPLNWFDPQFDWGNQFKSIVSHSGEMNNPELV